MIEKYNKIKNNLKEYIKSFNLFNSYNFEASNLSFLIDILAFFGYNQELSKEELLKQSFLNSSDDLNFIFAHAHNINKSIFSSPEIFVFEFNPLGFINVDYFEIEAGPVFSLSIDGLIKIISSRDKIILKNETTSFSLTGGLYVDKIVSINKDFPYYIEENIYENYTVFPRETKIYYYEDDILVDKNLYRIYEYSNFFTIFFDDYFFRFPQERIKISILVDDNTINLSSSKSLSFIGNIFKISGNVKNKLNNIEKENIFFRILNKVDKNLYNDPFKLKKSIILNKNNNVDYSNLFIYDFCNYFNLDYETIRYHDLKRELNIYPPIKVDKNVFKSFLDLFDRKTNFRFYKKINVFNPIISSLYYISNNIDTKIKIKINDNEKIIDLKKILLENYILDVNGNIYLEIEESFNDFILINNVIIDVSKCLNIYKIVIYSSEDVILESENFNLNNLNIITPPGVYKIRLYTKDFTIKNINNLFITNFIISNDNK